MKSMLLVLCGLLFATMAVAQTDLPTTVVYPTTTMISVWNEFQTTDGGLDNTNLWTNVWTHFHNPVVRVGFYAYGQVADPNFQQLYGGPALRTRGGTLELGFGGGFQNDHGQVGPRGSIYGVLVVKRFTTANWYENGGSWWFLSQNMYAANDHFEVGYRLQRFLGGGPMVRYTATVRNWAFQPYGAALYDGDRLNPILGFSMTHK